MKSGLRPFRIRSDWRKNYVCLFVLKMHPGKFLRLKDLHIMKNSNFSPPPLVVCHRSHSEQVYIKLGIKLLFYSWYQSNSELCFFHFLWYNMSFHLQMFVGMSNFMMIFVTGTNPSSFPRGQRNRVEGPCGWRNVHLKSFSSLFTVFISGIQFFPHWNHIFFVDNHEYDYLDGVVSKFNHSIER